MFLVDIKEAHKKACALLSKTLVWPPRSRFWQPRQPGLGRIQTEVVQIRETPAHFGSDGPWM